MRSPRISLAIALSAWSLPLGTAAQECETSSTIDPGTGRNTLHVTIPDQLAAFEGCTTLTGDISIESEYSGEFILNGITELKGTLSIPFSASTLGRVELRDLVESGNISFPGVFADISLPNLQRAADIDVFQEGESGEVDLNSLVEVDNIEIRGSWTSIKLESLKTVVKDIEFCGGRSCGAEYEEDDEREFPWLEINLPSLEKADYFDLQGDIKSVSVPNLEVVGYIPPTELVHSQGLRMSISEGGHLLDFDGPRIHTLNGSLQVYGAINSLSLGALGETTIGATFNARGPLKIYSTIQTAQFFYIWVDLESIWLPNMVDLGTVDVSFYHRIPCNDTLYQLWETQSSHSSQWEDYNTCLDYDYPQEGDDEEENGTETPPRPGDEEDTDSPGDEDTTDDTDDTDDTPAAEDSDTAPDEEDTTVDDTNDTPDIDDSDSADNDPPPAAGSDTPTTTNNTSSESGDSSDDEEYVPGNAAGGILLPAASSSGLALLVIGLMFGVLF
ncbi:hypothetical protein BJX66DRAFT_316320 [Aspergillus keveii]|uniref:GPI-anchored cell wall organization protein Ecm33 n=1 Tax=Aspergillus keveii TaxID=714993 RepID=A0ABR4FNR5_9EURO